MFRKCALTAVFLIALGLLVSANQVGAQTRARVRFARGASSATLRGRINGYKYVDYIVGARAGQILKLELRTTGSAEIVVFTPSDENIDGANGLQYTGEIEYTGDYKIRILQPRAFARRNNASNYTLRISIE
ncbi:MAG TPA: hypothetical protein VF604_07640 [Pyrinomonadaceae bacterium]